MRKKQCVAMLLAGGQGSRLGILTKKVAKPAVPYGGKYRIIDFPLSNCTNSGIDVVGVLTQYRPLELNAYIGSGSPWDLDLSNGGVDLAPTRDHIPAEVIEVVEAAKTAIINGEKSVPTSVDDCPEFTLDD